MRQSLADCIKQIVLTSILFFLSFSVFSQENSQELQWIELPSIPDEKGFNGSFTGIHNDALLVVGGANFPYRPVYEGGAKKYYSEIYVMTEDANGYHWKTGFNYPNEVAYGAKVNLDKGLLCIGGKNRIGSLKDVNLVTWNGESIQIDSWPSLPYTMHDMSAAKIGDMVYVAGGMADDKLANKFLVLNTANYGSENFEWEERPEFPGPARLQPVLVSQNTQYEPHIFLFGGSSYPEDVDDPFVTTDGLEFNPATNIWSKVANIQPEGSEPYALHGASGIPMGAHHLLFLGGVNRDRFYDAWKKERKIALAQQAGDSIKLIELNKWRYDYLTHEPEWFNFNKELLLYHTISGVWTVAGNYPFQSIAGGGFVKWKDGWIVAGGEIKPGVRTNKVYFGKSTYTPDFGFANWIVLLIYLSGMLFLGFFFMKKEASASDFFKGGGRIPWWAAGMSIFATMLSAITFMAVPAFTYASDWKRYLMAVTIFLMAYPVVKYYLPFFRRLNVTTAYEYLEHRFNYTVRLTGSVIFIVFMIARMAIVLFLPSLALTTVTGIDIYTCIILMGLITIVYCTMGGVEAVIWGDVIQGFVLLGGAFLSIVFLVNGTEGGLTRIIDIAIEHDKMAIFDFSFDLTGATFWVVVFGGLANNLITYTSDQAVIQRYMTTSSEKAASKSIMLNGVLSVVVSLVFYFIGTAMFGYYKTNPELLDFTMERTDSIFPYFIMTQLPVGVVGLLIAAIFAATMSTVSTNINSLSTAFTVDIYQRLFKGSSDKRQILVARLSGISLGAVGIVIALLMATWSIQSLYDYFQYVLGLLSSGLGGLFFVGIFLPRVKTKAALIGFVCSTLILFWVSNQTAVNGLFYSFIGLVSTILIALIASYLIKEPSKNLDGLTVKTMNLKSENSSI